VKIWENGSDFHYISEYSGSSATPWKDSAVFYYSGRQSLLSLLESLKLKRSLGKIWLPAYYCEQVIEFLPGFSFQYYDCDPLTCIGLTSNELSSDDLIILNCYFGIKLPEKSEIDNWRNKGVLIIEDHSQDPYSPLSMTSQADYCFASLRKTLPLPDGGVLWSPMNATLPQIPSTIPPVSAKRVAAMLAKKSYLDCEWSDKSIFREWYIEAEFEFDTQILMQMSAYSQDTLQNFDVDRWRRVRAINYLKFYEYLSEKSKMPFGLPVTSPMGIVLLEDSPLKRDELKRYLISHNVFPAILWPVPQKVPERSSKTAREFAARCLFLHCDGRYDGKDMQRIANFVNAFYS